MKNKQKIIYSLIAASIVTAIEIVYRKVGGHAAGGVYFDSHTWGELTNKTPNFIVLFLLVFVALLAYELLGKNKENAICPSCETSYQVPDVSKSFCPKCGEKAEKLEGFYKRHPEL